MQERRNSIAEALELRLSCTNPLMLLYLHEQIADLPGNLHVDIIELDVPQNLILLSRFHALQEDIMITELSTYLPLDSR